MEIVAKAMQDNPEVASRNRFAMFISNSDESVKNEFQEFLKKNRMSSHVWVFARRPKKQFFIRGNFGG